MKFTTLATFLSLSAYLAGGSAYAAASPQIHHVGNNESVHVTLSDSNLNRVLVKGDQISQIICPRAFCEAAHTKGDASGSFIVKVSNAMPFTAFVSTSGGRHFAMDVKGAPLSGQTLVLVPEGAATNDLPTGKSSPYRAHLIAFLKAMMQGRAIKGVGVSDITTSNAFKAINSKVQMRMVKIWSGGHFTGVEYRIKSLKNHAITLPDHLFYTKGVLAIAQSKQHLRAHGTSIVFEVLSNLNGD